MKNNVKLLFSYTATGLAHDVWITKLHGYSLWNHTITSSYKREKKNFFNQLLPI